MTGRYQQITEDTLMNRNGEISISKLKFQQQTLTDPGQLTDKIPLDETYAGWNRQAAVKAPGGP